MLSSLWTKVVGLFDKDFLFASFLPALIFGAALVITLMGVFGYAATFAMISALSTSHQVVATAIAVLAIAVGGYVLSVLRVSMLRFWAGCSSFPFGLTWGVFRLLEKLQRRRFRRMKIASELNGKWQPVLEIFIRGAAARLDVVESTPSNLIPLAQEIARDIRSWRDVEVSTARVKAFLALYNQATEEQLSQIYKSIKDALTYRMAEEDADRQEAAFKLDRQYGQYSSIRGTRLGNIVESYQQYASHRYNIEGEVFWPRLRKVIPDTYLGVVQDQRTQLDFSITIVTLATVFSVLAFLIGPWIKYDLLHWSKVTVLGALAGALFYRVAVRAAEPLGELVRASFDLFRLDLLKELDLPHPATFDEERLRWKQVSQLATYGVCPNFSIAERSKESS